MSTTNTGWFDTAVANGVAPIPFDGFQAISDDEIGVRLAGVDQVKDVNFTVTLNDDGTGTITPLQSWGTKAVLIYSNPNFTQPADFQRFSAFYPDQIVPPLDRAARELIALYGMMQSSLRAPMGETLGLLPSATQRAGQQLTFDAFGNPVAAPIQSIMGPPGSPGEGFASRAALQAANPAPVDGYDVFLTEPGREGKFVFSSSNRQTLVSNDPLNAISIPKTAGGSGSGGAWLRVYDGMLRPEWFGAVADDKNATGTDSSAAIQAMFTLAAFLGSQQTDNASFPGMVKCFFNGYYYCSTAWNLKTPLHILGVSGGMGGVVGGTRIRFPAGSAGVIINRTDTTGYTAAAVTATTGADGTIIENMSFQAGTTGSRPAQGTTHGILMRARATLHNVYVTSFAGHGIAIIASVSATPMQGNASGFHIRGGRVVANGDCGLWIEGSDANAGEIIGLDTFFNGRWGKYDKSFLGNIFVGGEDAGNGGLTYVNYPAGGQAYSLRIGQEAAGSTTQPGTNPNVWIAMGGTTGGYPTWVNGGTYQTGGSLGGTAPSDYFHPYVEGAQGYIQVSSSSAVWGGILGAGNQDFYASGARIRANLSRIWMDQGFVSGGLSEFTSGQFRLSGNAGFPGNAGTALGIFYKSDADGLVAYGGGTTNDVRILNRAGTAIFTIPTNTTRAVFGGNVELPAAGIVKVGANQVVGPRQGAITAGVNAAAAPTQAEFNALVTVVNAIRAALTAHGLTA